MMKRLLTYFAVILIPACGLDGTDTGAAGLQHLDPCSATEPCSADSYCAYPGGRNCGDEAAIGSCQPKPDVCAEIDQPVCGCDGETYENECSAQRQGVGVSEDGACLSSGCDPTQLPVCPPACPDDAFESCGQPCDDEGASCGNEIGDGRICTDGTWQCSAHPPLDQECNQVCKRPGQPVGFPCSAAEPCSDDGYCVYGADQDCQAAPNASGICELRPSPECDAIYQPVCGCDGSTYNSECIANSSGVSVARNEPCGGDPCGDLDLPECPPVCPAGAFDVCGQPCSDEGSTCGNEVGDGRVCTGGSWQCSIHDPLPPGCNLVCQRS